MENTFNKIKQIASQEPSKWLEEARARRENASWSDKSAKIAIRILREIRAQKPINGMSQKMLAYKMDVSAQYINKVVKGQENLTLETISKIEQVLKITLIEVPSFSSIQFILEQPTFSMGKIDRNYALAIGAHNFPFSFNSYSAGENEIEYIPNGTYGY